MGRTNRASTRTRCRRGSDWPHLPSPFGDSRFRPGWRPRSVGPRRSPRTVVVVRVRAVNCREIPARLDHGYVRCSLPPAARVVPLRFRRQEAVVPRTERHRLVPGDAVHQQALVSAGRDIRPRLVPSGPALGGAAISAVVSGSRDLRSSFASHPLPAMFGCAPAPESARLAYVPSFRHHELALRDRPTQITSYLSGKEVNSRSRQSSNPGGHSRRRRDRGSARRSTPGTDRAVATALGPVRSARVRQTDAARCQGSASMAASGRLASGLGLIAAATTWRATTTATSKVPHALEGTPWCATPQAMRIDKVYTRGGDQGQTVADRRRPRLEGPDPRPRLLRHRRRAQRRDRARDRSPRELCRGPLHDPDLAPRVRERAVQSRLRARDARIPSNLREDRRRIEQRRIDALEAATSTRSTTSCRS